MLLIPELSEMLITSSKRRCYEAICDSGEVMPERPVLVHTFRLGLWRMYGLFDTLPFKHIYRLLASQLTIAL